MKYNINYGGQVIDLPDYSFLIADKIEKQELINAGGGRFRDKCNSMYSLICDILGKEITENLIGKFVDCDPNEINILYLTINKAYNKPLEEYNENESMSVLDNGQFDKLIDLVNAYDKASKLKVIK